MPFKVSIFFSQQGDRIGGWSENFWNNGSDFDTMQTRTNNLVTWLRQCHGFQTNVNYARISRADNFRQIRILKFQGDGSAQAPASTESDYQVMSAGIVLTAEQSGKAYVTRQWIKGVEDSAINTGGRWNPNARQTGNFNKLWGILKDGGEQWCINKLDATAPKRTLLGITNAGVATVLGHGYDDLVNVRIARAKGTFAINQIWQIHTLDANTFQLIGYVPRAGTPVYLGGGKVQLQNRLYIQIGGAYVERATKHNVGRPFAQLTGRRPKRRAQAVPSAVA